MSEEIEVYDFGLRLKKLRQSASYTKKEIASRLGVSTSSIGRYEANTQLPPIDKLETMAILYNTSLDYLRNLTTRRAFYVDDLEPSQQEAILEIVERLKAEFKKSNNKK